MTRKEFAPLPTITATHTDQAPAPGASHRTIDHATECPFPWCQAVGLADDHTSMCDPYTPATLSLATESTERGIMFPAVGFGVIWDRTDNPAAAPAIALHIIGPRDDSQADLTVAEAIALRAQLDRVIGIATGLPTR